MDLVTTKPHLLALLTALVDTAAPLDGAEIGLFQNNITPDANTVLADLTECDYTGYAQEAITWLVPSISDAGTPQVVGTVVEFRPTGTTVTNFAYGLFMLDGSGAFVGAARFPDAPYPMQATTDSIVVMPAYQVSDSGQVAVVS